MRRYLASVVALAFLLFGLSLMAQTSSSSDRHHGAATTTTTTTTTQSTTTGQQQSVEGCLVKEASDYFLIPAHGNPIQLQASTGQDLSAHEGHKVKLRGVESSLSASGNAGSGGTGGAAGTAASTTTTTASGAQSSTSSISGQADKSSGNMGAASGTGENLHRLADKQMTVSNLDHIATSCPVNWNPNVPTKKGSSKY